MTEERDPFVSVVMNEFQKYLDEQPDELKFVRKLWTTLKEANTTIEEELYPIPEANDNLKASIELVHQAEYHNMFVLARHGEQMRAMLLNAHAALLLQKQASDALGQHLMGQHCRDEADAIYQLLGAITNDEVLAENPSCEVCKSKS